MTNNVSGDKLEKLVSDPRTSFMGQIVRVANKLVQESGVLEYERPIKGRVTNKEVAEAPEKHEKAT